MLTNILRHDISFDASELLGAVIDNWGGPHALAADLRQDYLSAKPGSMTRQRIVEMISRLTVQVTNQGATSVKDPISMTDEEIMSEASRLMAMIRIEPEVKGDA